MNAVPDASGGFVDGAQGNRRGGAQPIERVESSSGGKVANNRKDEEHQTTPANRFD